jgi:hypothetical protein
VQTVYNVVGEKAVLLKTVDDVTLAGDDEPIPMVDRPSVRAVLDAPTARESLACYAELGRAIAERVLPLVGMALAQAASGDAELASFAETIEAERAAGTTAAARRVAERFGLRDGVDVHMAQDILWALTSPEPAHRLVNRRHWGRGQIPDLAGHRHGRCARRPQRMTELSAWPATLRTAPGSRTGRSWRTGGGAPDPDRDRRPPGRSRCRWG